MTASAKDAEGKLERQARRSQGGGLPQSLPSWLKLVLSAQAAVQWALFGLSWSLPGDRYVLGLPMVPVAMLLAAVVLSIATVLVWAFSHNRLLLRLLALLQRARAHPLSLILPGLCLALAVPYLLRVYWLGNTLFGVQLSLLALLLYLVHPAAWSVSHGRLLSIAPILVIALGLGLRLWLLAVDFVWIDEGFHLSATASMLEGNGVMPAMMRFPDNVPIAPWRGYAFGVYGLWAKVFGLGLRQARALSYLIGLLALPLIYGTARLWYGHWTGLVTTSIAAMSLLFLSSTNGRTDTLPMLAISLTLFTHAYARQKGNVALHAVTGILAVLALETHYINLMFFATWGGVYAVEYLLEVREGGGWLRRAPLWYFLAGAIPGLLLYYYVHVLRLPHPEGAFSSTVGLTIPTGNLLRWRLDTAVNRLWQVWTLSPPETVILLAATVSALVRRTDGDKHWLLLAAFTVLAYFVVESNGSVHHTLYALPLWIGSAGALVTHGLARHEQPGSVWERVAYLGVVFLLATQAVGVIRQHSKSRLA